jgi:DHA1 family tetracycline resistance protein-like MFS transporter
VALAVAIGFSVTFWFSGMEQTFRLFTEDAFGMSVATTGRIFGLLGLVTAIVQGGLIHRLTRRFGEVRLVRAGAPVLAVGLALIALGPSVRELGRAALITGSCTLALGYGLLTPSLSSYTSRQAGAHVQGSVLGVLQSMSALARALGPAAGGLLYQFLGMRAPYAVGAVGMFVAGLLALGLPPLAMPSRKPVMTAPP